MRAGSVVWRFGAGSLDGICNQPCGMPHGGVLLASDDRSRHVRRGATAHRRKPSGRARDQDIGSTRGAQRSRSTQTKRSTGTGPTTVAIADRRNPALAQQSRWMVGAVGLGVHTSNASTRMPGALSGSRRCALDGSHAARSRDAALAGSEPRERAAPGASTSPRRAGRRRSTPGERPDDTSYEPISSKMVHFEPIETIHGGKVFDAICQIIDITL
jgi:hypothetical protein